ncbi:MAG: A/G-specific adenine glycosylase [Phycisphaerales bacterium]
MAPRKRTTDAAVQKTTRRDDDAVDAAVVAMLIEWFLKHARDLPWRASDPKTALRDPYRVLVSEVMLQQTQVSRVEPKFRDFLTRFPTIRDLANAPESDVLAAWTGLGYYRRARMLHAAAKKVVEDFAGDVPRNVEALRSLPGIGAYTSGAIASLAHGEASPLVDTNVSRVLLRLAGKPMKTSDPLAVEWCWAQATKLVRHAKELNAKLSREKAINAPGAFNESLMELGATVCTLSTPACNRCPVASRCAAFKAGIQDQIPLAPDPKKRTAIVHAVLVVRDERKRVLVEPRSDAAHKNALWEGLWQAPTLECAGAPKSAGALAKKLGIDLEKERRFRKSHDFVFKTTLRDVRFVVWETEIEDGASLVRGSRTWKTLSEVESLAMSSPMRRILIAKSK